jgi:hypothetical protein
MPRREAIFGKFGRELGADLAQVAQFVAVEAQQPRVHAGS